MLSPKLSRSIERATDSREKGLTLVIFVSVLVATLASFNKGWNTGSPNISEKVIRGCQQDDTTGLLPGCLPMGDLLWGFNVAIMQVGGLLGGLAAGPIADQLGRKKTLLLNNVNFVLGGLLIALSMNTSMFAVGRFLIGLGSGTSTVVAPIYIAESSTIRYRGAMGTLLQVSIAFGILFSQITGLWLATVPLWRVLFGLTILFAALQVVLLAFCPETPRYLLSNMKIDEAKKSLQKLRKGCNIEHEFHDMVSGGSLDNSLNGSKERSLRDRMRGIMADGYVRRMLFVGIGLHVSQQLSGVNGVTLYSTSMFHRTIGPQLAPYMTICIAALNVLLNLCSSMLIDRSGRRPLLLISTGGMFLSCLLLVMGDILNLVTLNTLSVFLYTSSFSIGSATIPFMIIAELVPTWATGVVVSIATATNWACYSLVVFIFPTLITSLGAKAFIIFAVTNGVALIFIYLSVPETKGRSIDEIAARNHYESLD
ncbi:general substrate transporter [Basidiobolus meristosporus CBS 931.73]|uniref:General substrate transporter n=1 Tax=Basidiobolus meristosporus CBS 931.73 TaxID=1314790 RepID=A0A1Y1YGP4_9FUNG|nr:general substrate transporter [Basidiobolus meristosporus CBS 931.73]|eukprot:ORX96814.1 general substrate transporter [Basidiobolus meristosporus CBS 931.73]